MHSGWDCTSAAYVAEWLPQFAPYDADLARELAVHEGNAVLTSAGAEAITFARAVGETGSVHVVDAREKMCALCKERIASAGLEKRVTILASAARGYDVVALVHVEDASTRLGSALRAACAALASNGKVGLLHWGPDEATDPERVFARAVETIAPEALEPKWERLAVDRASIASMFESAGLALVRHTVVSHAIVFPSAERFARSLLAARAYGARLTALGEERVGAVLARFYEGVAGQDHAITYAPVATIAVAGLPGAELELSHRPSVRIPAVIADKA